MLSAGDIGLDELHFFLLHGSFQFRVPKWERQFQSSLVERGISRQRIHMPHLRNLFANYRSWIRDSRLPNSKQVSASTVLVGHSSGSAMALSYAEEHPVCGMILFAPYDTPDIGPVGLRPLMRPLEKSSGMFTKQDSSAKKHLWRFGRRDREFKWNRIVKNSGFITIVHSTGDLVVPAERSRGVFEKLNTSLKNKGDIAVSKIVFLVVEGSGHTPEQKHFLEIIATIPHLGNC